MHTLIVILGANRGNILQTFENVRNETHRTIGNIISQSSIFESEPWGFDDSHFFLNQLLIITTTLSPHECLHQCLRIETLHGRERSSFQGYESRTIDIDILYYDSQIIHSATLTIPHPHIQNRKFVLLPLVECIPDFVHPILQKTQLELLAACTDTCKVKKHNI